MLLKQSLTIKKKLSSLQQAADLIMALRDVVQEKGWNSEEAINR
jgi:hypothetical protein